MDLRDFVRTTLVQIIEGVAGAQGAAAEATSAVINPRRSNEQRTAPIDVQFDVAVTVTEEAGKEGSAKLTVAWVKLGGGVSASSQNQAVSRISFAVPVALPSQTADQYRSGEGRLSPAVPRGQGGF